MYCDGEAMPLSKSIYHSHSFQDGDWVELDHKKMRLPNLNWKFYDMWDFVRDALDISKINLQTII